MAYSRCQAERELLSLGRSWQTDLGAMGRSSAYCCKTDFSALNSAIVHKVLSLFKQTQTLSSHLRLGASHQWRAELAKFTRITSDHNRLRLGLTSLNQHT